MQEVYFLKRLNLNLYNMSVDDLQMLKRSVDDELDSRNEIDSKVKAIELAESVQQATGNDQNVPTLKAELFAARKKYALRISQFDDLRYTPGYVPYDTKTGLPYGVEDFSPGTNYQTNPDNHLKPLPENTVAIKATDPSTVIVMDKTDNQKPDGTPVWKITRTEEDGTETVLGYQ